MQFLNFASCKSVSALKANTLQVDSHPPKKTALIRQQIKFKTIGHRRLKISQQRKTWVGLSNITLPLLSHYTQNTQLLEKVLR